jgi:heterodisulfide reductase subunit D
VEIEKIIDQTKTFYCFQECNICKKVCSLSGANPLFSHRSNMEKCLPEIEADLLQGSDLWSCFTCGRCSVGCPTMVDYLGFIRAIREEARNRKIEGIQPIPSHGGILNEIMELQTLPRNQKRLSWLSDDLKTAEKGEVYYFVGCAPFFSVIYRDLGVDSLATPKDAIRLFNGLAITPVVSNGERCCGHDLYWVGDTENFLKLAEANITAIAKTGAKKVIFTCPEGYYTFKVTYPKYFGKLSFETIHLLEFLVPYIEEKKITFEPLEEKVTYHDPCRLGRFMEIYEEPRIVLEEIPALELIEMERIKEYAVCCGASNWMNCGKHTKTVQKDRLMEAIRTGADTLVTACPKCQIHLNCALKDLKEENPSISINITDIYCLISKTLS